MDYTAIRGFGSSSAAGGAVCGLASPQRRDGRSPSAFRHVEPQPILRKSSLPSLSGDYMASSIVARIPRQDGGDGRGGERRAFRSLSRQRLIAEWLRRSADRFFDRADRATRAHAGAVAPSCLNQAVSTSWCWPATASCSKRRRPPRLSAAAGSPRPSSKGSSTAGECLAAFALLVGSNVTIVGNLAARSSRLEKARRRWSDAARMESVRSNLYF